MKAALVALAALLISAPAAAQTAETMRLDILRGLVVAPGARTVDDVRAKRTVSRGTHARRVFDANGNLVERARRYMGTNPTGRARLWCGDFMAMIAPQAAALIRNPRAARDWAQLPKVGPRVGAIVVLRRGSGGHVGVVTGFEGRNPVVVSGNHNRVVGEGVYPASRVIAYVDGG